MSTSSSPIPFSERPVLVIALGGNALSPPVAGNEHYSNERAIVAQTGKAMTQLAAAGYRLVIVHGNGPQVGRLLQADPDPDPGRSNLDIHVAQTQGELGYLLMNAIDAPVTCLLTRVVVDAELGPAVKPIGPILSARPPASSAAVEVTGGWRLAVPSPRPADILETDAIATQLRTHHVIAGGGGGVPLTADGKPVSAVVDKDWVASLLAVELDAQRLLFATDVDHVYERFGQPDAAPLEHLSVQRARALLDAAALAPGSMAPKVASAVDFVAATGRSANICALPDIPAALAGAAGTVIG